MPIKCSSRNLKRSSYGALKQEENALVPLPFQKLNIQACQPIAILLDNSTPPARVNCEPFCLVLHEAIFSICYH